MSENTTHVAVPTTVDIAKMMVLLGTDYLQQHAPDVLKPPQQSAQPVEVQKTPGMAVQALAGEIIAALLADEKDGGYDLTAGLFGANFSKLVRRWANAEYGQSAQPLDVKPVGTEFPKTIEAWFGLPAAQPVAGLDSLTAALVAECERAMAQRDKFRETGVSTASHGGSHDTLFGQILREHTAKFAQLVEVQPKPATLSAEQLNDGLKLHRLTWDKPSQLADGFRAGANWGYTLKLPC